MLHTVVTRELRNPAQVLYIVEEQQLQVLHTVVTRELRNPAQVLYLVREEELPGAAHCRHQGAQEPCTGVLDVW